MRHRIRTERERARHVVRAPHYSGGGIGEREAGFAELREALITHYSQALKHQRVGWLAPARAARPAPHLQTDEAPILADHAFTAVDDLVYVEDSDATSEGD